MQNPLKNTGKKEKSRPLSGTSAKNGTFTSALFHVGCVLVFYDVLCFNRGTHSLSLSFKNIYTSLWVFFSPSLRFYLTLNSWDTGGVTYWSGNKSPGLGKLALARELYYMISRGPFQPVPFCDSVIPFNCTFMLVKLNFSNSLHVLHFLPFSRYPMEQCSFSLKEHQLN